jgi:hypothetical protein
VLLKKLLALAERGIDGEKTSAQRRIRRLKARFDFSAPAPAETPDLFSGSFNRSATARPIYSFHLCTLAVGLGKQIRLSAPVEEIAAELEVALRKCLAQEHADSPPPASKT